MSSDNKNTQTPKVFLGGTCNESTWRDELIELLEIDFFNPVVDDWTPDCMVEELRQREQCDYVLYVITPEMTGVYSIAEVVDDSNKQPEKTVFCIMSEYGHKTFSDGQLKSLMSVGRMVERNGGKYIINDFNAVSYYLNRG
ncbi:nucleoside 2-deoxyribosyltransferase domain-containing protein [Candidatus Calescamantes bacterium]|nr:nucleoside 2-deoxyribosyltransferase domain-containing protein [Candidatus Calescamantes bacterium]